MPRFSYFLNTQFNSTYPRSFNYIFIPITMFDKTDKTDKTKMYK